MPDGVGGKLLFSWWWASSFNFSSQTLSLFSWHSQTLWPSLMHLFDAVAGLEFQGIVCPSDWFMKREIIFLDLLKSSRLQITSQATITPCNGTHHTKMSFIFLSFWNPYYALIVSRTLSDLSLYSSLTYSRCSLNISWVNEQMKTSKFICT